MNTKARTKLCWNCEGRVSLEEKNCPFCAVYLNNDLDSDEDQEQDYLDPPYNMNTSEDHQNIPSSPYGDKNSEVMPQKAQKQTDVQEGNDFIDDMKHVVIPLSLLLFGSVFFLFGMVLFLFSQNGVFTLHWNGAYWFIYQLIAIPFLIFGWKSLQYVK